jgi:hypothetical protein
MNRNQISTQTKDTLLVDEVRVSPVDTQLLRNHRRVLWILALSVALILLIGLV